MVHANLDHRAVGCGWRTFIEAKVGVRWVKLLYVPSLTFVSIPVDDDAKERILADRQGKRVSTLDDHNMETYAGLFRNRPTPMAKYYEEFDVDKVIKQIEERVATYREDGSAFAEKSVEAVLLALRGVQVEIADTENEEITMPKTDATTGERKARSNHHDTLMEMLTRATGASIDEIVKDTGWQPHSARAAISGVRKTKAVDKTKEEGRGTVYRLAKEQPK